GMDMSIMAAAVDWMFQVLKTYVSLPWFTGIFPIASLFLGDTSKSKYCVLICGQLVKSFERVYLEQG
ncbi:hypothetical protein G9A89_000532, partial [Geosiphon pyriformis]